MKKSATCVLFILLAISIFVANQTLNGALHDKTKEQLLRFGANIIVRPKGEIFDLYSAAGNGAILLPESHTAKIRDIERKHMLIAVSPKLYERFTVGGKSLLVAGVTSNEGKAKPWWLISGDLISAEFPEEGKILLGHHAAAMLGEDISEVKLGDESFTVSAVLDETGSSDDFMAFVPLPALQRLTRKDGMVNLIEVTTSCIACKAMNINDVVKDIENALPSDAHVMSVKQIAEAQMGTLRNVMAFTWVISLVVLSLCVLLLMNYLSASVEERRREIGMLLAMGMDPRKIQAIFVSKMLILAAIGGLLGYVTGSGVSVLLGPLLADARVSPMPSLLPVAFIVSLGLAILSSILPARRISKLDPVEALREV